MINQFEQKIIIINSIQIYNKRKKLQWITIIKNKFIGGSSAENQ